MISVVDVEIQASNPIMPLFPWRAFENSPSSLRIRNVPKKIGTWQITAVDIQVEYPDNSIFRKRAKLVGGVWIATLDGSSLSGLVTNGYSIIASGIDEDGNAIGDYILGKGDVEILDSDSIIEAGIDVSAVKLYKSKPSEIKNGDCWFEDDILVICDKDTEKRIEGFKPTVNQLAVLNSGITSNKVANYDSAYAKIPAQTFEPNNELADKAFVNSSVQTATANFRGNWATYEDVPSNANDYPEDYQGIKTPSTNDYMVVENYNNNGTWRFKYVGNWGVDGKNGWKQEYQVNETPLTANQLAALNSGITSDKVNKIDASMPYYKFVNLPMYEEYIEDDDFYYSYYKLQPFCNNNLTDGIWFDEIYVDANNIPSNTVRDLLVTVENPYYSEQLFWDTDIFVPVNEDEDNIMLTENKINIFYLTEFSQGKFLVSKQVV